MLEKRKNVFQNPACQFCTPSCASHGSLPILGVHNITSWDVQKIFASFWADFLPFDVLPNGGYLFIYFC